MASDSGFNNWCLEPMVWQGNLAENWKAFYQDYEINIRAAGKKEAPDDVRCSLLLCRVGREGMKLYNTFVWDNEADKLKTDTVVAKFKEHCVPKTNRAYERYKFWQRAQGQYETFAVYLTDLRKMASGCEFGNQHDSLICDRIVCGITSDSLREKLLRKDDLTLENAIKICQADEVTRLRAEKMTSHESSEVVLAVGQSRSESGSRGSRRNMNNRRRFNNERRNAFSTDAKSCSRCGRIHPPRRCPAFKKQCDSCGVQGHFAVCCPDKVDEVQKERYDDAVGGGVDGENRETFQIDAVSANVKSTDSWYINLQLASKQELKVKVDTGASTNCMSLETFKRHFPNRNPTNTCKKLIDYSNNIILQLENTMLFVILTAKSYVYHLLL